MIAESDLRRELRLTREVAKRIANYLCEENLLEFLPMYGAISIASDGTKEMEKALSNPQQPTKHFPAVVDIIKIVTDTLGHASASHHSRQNRFPDR